jgi:hypothetical protein
MKRAAAAKRLVKIAAKIVRLRRSVIFHMAKVTVPRALFQNIRGASRRSPAVATGPMLRIAASGSRPVHRRDTRI